MYTREDASSLISPMIESNAERIMMNRGISDFSYTDSYPVVNLRATVSDYLGDHNVFVELDEEHKTIVSSRCNCLIGRITGLTCEHKAALLLAWAINREEGHITLTNEASHERRTDRAVQQFIRNQSQGYQADRSGTVFLEAEIESLDSSNHSISVEFRIGRENARSYVLKSVENLIHAEHEESTLKFGKNLSFIPCEESFNRASRPLYRFLRRLVESDDSYHSESSSYYYNSSYYSRYVGRYLSLKGSYLDEFMTAIRDLPLVCKSGQKTIVYHLSDAPYQPDIKIEAKEGGIAVSAPRIDFLKGSEYLYFLNDRDRTIHRVNAVDNRMLVPFLELVSDTANKPLFIGSADVGTFIGTAFPVVKQNFTPELIEFEPAKYLPPEPSFSFYLDLPQDGMITCEAFACYDDARWNIFETENVDPAGRNLAEEKGVETAIAHWFNSYDPLTHRMVIINDDDKIAEFLTDGIPFLKAKGEVYISDSLKRLQVRSMPRVSIGVSMSNDLLQLNIEGETKSLEDLAEILSRYTPKKKYYRLKNGSFIQIDNEEELAELARLSEDLQLSAKDIRAGGADLPAYRAMYIEKAADEADHIEINRDSYFHDLISRMDETDRSYEIPESLNGVLRDYQKTGYSWFRRLYDNHFAGLLADEMGLGKTLQVITFLLSLENRGQSLVICPASLVYNWMSEFQRFAPEIPVVIIAGTAEHRRTLINSAAENAVLVTSYDTLKRDTDHYKGKQFEVEVLDEAQYIKNAATIAAESVKLINARFRIALTGTPIENRLAELWSIFDYLLPGFLFRYNYFRTHYENPIVKSQDKISQEALRRMIAPFVLRRRKTEVLTELPEKLEEVYYAPLEAEQQELYEARAQRLRIMLAKESDAEFRKNKIAVLAEITRLRQTCCAPSLIYENYRGNSAKEDLCIELIRNAVNSGHKVLLFSQFKTMLETLNRRLEAEGIRYHFLSGETPKETRARMVESFQKDDVPVFSISLKAGGTGLNLTAADIVIHYDPWWNTAVENQASDRTHRIGQTKVVTVYRLIVQNTIEERILQLQEKKADLAGEILSGEELSSSSLTREQLMDIL